jgi:hypothetical protein
MKLAIRVKGNGTFGIRGDEGMNTICARRCANLGILLGVSCLGIYGCGFRQIEAKLLTQIIFHTSQ